MAIAATAIDLSAAMDQRRQDQTAADLASLAAVQFADGSDATNTTKNGTDEAIAVAEATLGITGLDWGSCDRPSSVQFPHSTVDCIAFTTNWARARVIIPDIDVDTTFGAVLGADSIATSAHSDALYRFSLEGKVLPFALPANASDHLCLKTSPHANSSTPPCDDSDEGNFGTLDITVFGNPELGTLTACNNSHAQGRIQVNIAKGVDHSLGIFTGSNYLHDKDACDAGGDVNSAPNHVPGQTGVGNNLYPGMIEGVSQPQLLVDGTAPGRLAQGDNRITVDSGSPDIDNTPLWHSEFFSGINGTSCDAAVIDSNEAMLQCIEDWDPGDGQLFTEEIASAVRFGAVPSVPDAWDPGKNPMGYPIIEITPIYIQGTIWKCTGGGNCQIAHFPGDTNSAPCSGWPAIESCGVGGNANGDLAAVTAFVLNIEMFPESIQDTWPNTPNSGRINLIDPNQ